MLDRRPKIVLVDSHETGAQERLCIVHSKVAVVAVCDRGVEAAYGHFEVGKNVFRDGIPPVVQGLPQRVVGGVLGLGGENPALDLECRVDALCQGLLRILPAGHDARGYEQGPEEDDGPLVDGRQSGTEFVSLEIRRALEFEPPALQDDLGVAFLGMSPPRAVVRCLGRVQCLHDIPPLAVVVDDHQTLAA
jgi:hypothetical protein